ncbi:MAG: 5'/3'-nucleotidase SurE [Spirochaetaceae bacterium]|jgi:5'-nucleotidase|nr:5'/3'-nucleotidase SurE [Spirochaetaceae bacterium]
MNILATNDDGYLCQGIISLAEKLRAAGHRVTILAPDRERSCASHSMSLNGGIAVKKLGDDLYICSGTPVDCAFIGVSEGFGLNPDLVVSGINAGANLGIDVIFSGTVGAARQAALHKIPAIAFSLCGYREPMCWEPAASWAAAHLDELAALWNEAVFVSVNMPNIETLPEKAAITKLSGRRYRDGVILQPPGPDGYAPCEFTFGGLSDETCENSDRDTVIRGLVSVSVIYIEQSTALP